VSAKVDETGGRRVLILEWKTALEREMAEHESGIAEYNHPVILWV
jgi:hypothetical protein